MIDVNPVNLLVHVCAEIAPGVPDYTAFARFANSDRASEYARILEASGMYTGVCVTDSNSREWWWRK